MLPGAAVTSPWYRVWMESTTSTPVSYTHLIGRDIDGNRTKAAVSSGNKPAPRKQRRNRNVSPNVRKARIGIKPSVRKSRESFLIWRDNLNREGVVNGIFGNIDNEITSGSLLYHSRGIRSTILNRKS